MFAGGQKRSFDAVQLREVGRVQTAVESQRVGFEGARGTGHTDFIDSAGAVVDVQVVGTEREGRVEVNRGEIESVVFNFEVQNGFDRVEEVVDFGDGEGRFGDQEYVGRSCL
jgi:hypothetical protein